jgi:alanine racemase
VRELAPGSKVLAVIKANAYGHGSVPSAVALAGADGFAVARLEEAMALRAAGLTQRIVLLEGVFSTRSFVRPRIMVSTSWCIHEPEQLAMLDAWRGDHGFGTW